MKKIFCLTIVLFVLSILSLSAEPKKYTNNIYWEITPSGELVISGRGPLQRKGDKYPWEKGSRRDLINSLQICEGITEINKLGLLHVNKIILPSTLKCVGSGAFAGFRCDCPIILPDSVTQISRGAFYNTEVNEIVISKNVSKIDALTFTFSTVKKITFRGHIFKMEEGAFDWCKNLNTVIFLGDVDEISNEAFKDCRSLRTVLVGDSLKRIGDEAFYGTSLEDFVFPESLTYIGECAFCGTRLNNISIPSSVDTIASFAFAKLEYKEEGRSFIIKDNTSKPIVLGKGIFVGSCVETIHIPRNAEIHRESLVRSAKTIDEKWRSFYDEYNFYCAALELPSCINRFNCEDYFISETSFREYIERKYVNTLAISNKQARFDEILSLASRFGKEPFNYIMDFIRRPDEDIIWSTADQKKWLEDVIGIDIPYFDNDAQKEVKREALISMLSLIARDGSRTYAINSIEYYKECLNISLKYEYDRKGKLLLEDQYMLQILSQNKDFLPHVESIIMSRYGNNGNLYYDAGNYCETLKDYNLAFYFYSKSKDNYGGVHTLNKLGEYYATGVGVDKDTQTAISMYKEALNHYNATDETIIVSKAGLNKLGANNVIKEYNDKKEQERLKRIAAEKEKQRLAAEAEKKRLAEEAARKKAETEAAKKRDESAAASQSSYSSSKPATKKPGLLYEDEYTVSQVGYDTFNGNQYTTEFIFSGIAEFYEDRMIFLETTYDYKGIKDGKKVYGVTILSDDEFWVDSDYNMVKYTTLASAFGITTIRYSVSKGSVAPTYSAAGMASDPMPSPPVPTSDSDNSIWESYYRTTYARFESLAEDQYNTIASIKNQQNNSGYMSSSTYGSQTTIMLNLFHDTQRKLQRVRNEAAQHGVNIPASRWETTSIILY